MNKYLFICNYCNFSWERAVWTNIVPSKDEECIKCKSKNCTVKQVDYKYGDIYGYYKKS